jgi:hypothetical protein
MNDAPMDTVGHPMRIVKATWPGTPYCFVNVWSNPVADRDEKVVAVAVYVWLEAAAAAGHTGVVVIEVPLYATVSEAVATMVPPSPFDSAMMNCKQPPVILAVAAAGGNGGVAASPQL